MRASNDLETLDQHNKARRVDLSLDVIYVLLLFFASANTTTSYTTKTLRADRRVINDLSLNSSV